MEAQGKAVAGWVRPVTHQALGCGPRTSPLSLGTGSSLPPLLPDQVFLELVYLLQDTPLLPSPSAPLTALTTLWSL